MDEHAQSPEQLETPSGKGAADENFPVGSRLIAPRLRPHVAIFYAFARAIDDIADNPALAPEDKIARLDAFAEAVAGGRAAPGLEKAVRMRDSLAATGVTTRHCLDLVSAFRQDAVKRRYADWAELMDYCDRSAAPVGRYLLDLHGESRDLWPANDALCNALQVINHLQDCGDDYRKMDRVYLPADWMAEAGAEVSDLGAAHLSPGLRRVLDRCLEGCRQLTDAARALPAGLGSRRLAAESAVILEIARRLTARLAREDPLAGRVVLGRGALVGAGIVGIFRVLAGRYR